MRGTLGLVRRLAVVGAALALLASPVGAESLPASLKAMNRDFRSLYAQARVAMLKNVPIALVSLPDRLVMYRHGKRGQEFPYQLSLYTRLKTLAHIPLALYTMFAAHDGELTPQQRAELADLGQRLASVQAELSPAAFSPLVLARQQDLLASTRVFAARVLASGRLSSDELVEYCRRMQPLQMANVEQAVKILLDDMNRVVGELMFELSAKERNTYYVVVTGVHQARAGNLQVQYFRALLDEPGLVENRVIYAENVMMEKGALVLLGDHVLDQRMARAFFDDPLRLQRDVLADAARAYIPSLELPR